MNKLISVSEQIIITITNKLMIQAYLYDIKIYNDMPIYMILLSLYYMILTTKIL